MQVRHHLRNFSENYFFEHFDDVKDEAIKVFEMYSMYEEMSNEEFEKGAY